MFPTASSAHGGETSYACRKLILSRALSITRALHSSCGRSALSGENTEENKRENQRSELKLHRNSDTVGGSLVGQGFMFPLTLINAVG